MIEVIISQNEATQETAKSFETIAENTMGISGTSESLAGIVKDLALSNKEIVDSITTISSISEEVASHANQGVNTALYGKNLFSLQETTKLSFRVVLQFSFTI